MIGTGEDIADLVFMLAVFAISAMLFVLSMEVAGILMDAQEVETMGDGEGSRCFPTEKGKCYG